ncbi:MAG TPA: hypothetical protein VNW46_15380 [Gemmatimonadaceae bacterium]|nr:hypothetical protein [Gemmatimonadaceae bacterium]
MQRRDSARKKVLDAFAGGLDPHSLDIPSGADALLREPARPKGLDARRVRWMKIG